MFGLDTIVLVGLVVAAFVLRGRNKRLEGEVRELANRLNRLDDRTSWQAAAPAQTGEPSPPREAPKEPAAPPKSPPMRNWPLPAPETSPKTQDMPEPEVAEPSPPPTPPSIPEASEGARRFEWERLIGLRLPIWLGAIALSVAGFFFVSYAIESGFFTPEMRVLSAAAAALAFLAAAEFVRKRVKTDNVAAITSALGAASIATMYATAYLATKIYGLAPSGTGFILTIMVSILAIAIALAYGELVALVGLIGGYVAPAVYGGGEANAGFLTIYLAALTAVSFALIRLKDWWRLSPVGLIGPLFWGIVWAGNADLLADAYWGSVFLISLPLIVAAAAWPAWQEDGDILDLHGITKPATPQRAALISASAVAAAGFGVFLANAGFPLAYWQGLIVFAGAAVALGFVSPPHRVLQLPIVAVAAVILTIWPHPDATSVFVVTGLLALIFGFGALDQFRRLREPAVWALVLGFVLVYFYFVALFKISGWQGALEQRHAWALGGLAISGGLVALLRYYGPRLEQELVRSQVYAAWGGAVTTLVSLAVVLELDSLYYPVASALGILGLAAVHMRATVRGLRVLAGVYLAAYVALILGALSYFGSPFYWPGYGYAFARNLPDHSIMLLLVPGLALLAAGTLFQMRRGAESASLVAALDATGLIATAAGLYYALAWSWFGGPFVHALEFSARIVGPELLLAAAAIYCGRRFDRPVLLMGGMVLTGLTMIAMFFVEIAPLLQFWPPFAVPGPIILNITLLAYGLPAAVLYFIGWYLRQRPVDENVRTYGIGVSLFAVLTTYTMLMVDVRQAWHLGEATLRGETSQSEFYAYSIVTLAFGLVLLIGGLLFRHRGARAVSLAFVLAATIKVFLFDASELTGLWRVLSFLLMGLSFLGISWAYARFVFGIGVVPRPSPAEETGPSG